MRGATESFRKRVRASATGPFRHAEYPLANTLQYPGDPGVCGPGAVSWPLIGDIAAFVGGIRALLVQTAHPEVVAGVADHSRYREDPLGRLSRTSAYVTATTFGAVREVERAVSLVRRAHATVVGRSHRGRAYSAGVPALSAWVHNVLTDSFLAAHQAYGPRPVSSDEADRFVREQARIGRMLDADPVPDDAASLSRWIEEHPDLGPSPGMRNALAFLADPPLDPAQKIGYGFLYRAAVAVTPPRVRRVLGVREVRGARSTGRAAVSLLRWALGSSPSWNLALIRTGSPVPDGVFRQPLPVELPPDWSHGRR